jgi:hypothetical protein
MDLIKFSKTHMETHYALVTNFKEMKIYERPEKNMKAII